MKSLFISFVFACFALLSLVACDAAREMPTRTPNPSPDMLTQMFDAQDAATRAAENANRVAATAQRIAAQATTQAQATREYVVLQGQQTRIAQEARERATVFAQNIEQTRTAAVANQTRIAQEARERATVFAQNVSATGQAASANQTRYADQSRATATANAANASATAQAAQYTATAQAGYLEATRASASATATAQAVIVEQTRTSASATATAQSDNRTATRAAEMKTATHDNQVAITFAEKQSWERTTESVRSVGMMLGVVLFVVGGVLMLGWVTMRVVTVETARRAREHRDANDELVLVMPNGDVARPDRMPGAFLPTLPTHALPPGTVDADATRRAQAVSLALAGVTLEDDAERETDAPAQSSEMTQWEIEQAFASKPLQLAQQPSRLSLPIGTKQDGSDLWVPLAAFPHGLVGGSSGMGKTRFLHGWIAALQYGGKAELMLMDRKAGVEFARYAGKPRTTYVEDDQIERSLDGLMREIETRNQFLRQAGATNIAEFNRTPGVPTTFEHIVVIIDEIADLQDDKSTVDTLIELARKSRSSGVHLVFATQNPDSKTIHPQILANAILRVAFSVPAVQNSMAILGASGAQKIGGIPGRMLVSYGGTLVPCQAYQIEPPRPPTREITPPEPPAALLDAPTDLPARGTDLPDNIAQMVRVAVGQLDGWFKIAPIATALGVQTDAVNAAARWLEERGLVTPVQKDAHGYNKGRHISDSLRAAYGG